MKNNKPNREVIELLRKAQASMHIQLTTRGGPQHMAVAKKSIEKFLKKIGEDYAG